MSIALFQEFRFKVSDFVQMVAVSNKLKAASSPSIWNAWETFVSYLKLWNY